MGDFPESMKNPANRIAHDSQYTEGIEGYVFDGAEGSQVAFWKCDEDRVSKSPRMPSTNTCGLVGKTRNEVPIV
jgi:hypothetical protein